MGEACAKHALTFTSVGEERSRRLGIMPQAYNPSTPEVEVGVVGHSQIYSESKAREGYTTLSQKHQYINKYLPGSCSFLIRHHFNDVSTGPVM